MATSKLNKEQYANIGSFAGIMLVYNSTNKDGELVQTAQHFSVRTLSLPTSRTTRFSV